MASVAQAHRVVRHINDAKCRDARPLRQHARREEGRLEDSGEKNKENQMERKKITSVTSVCSVRPIYVSIELISHDNIGCDDALMAPRCQSNTTDAAAAAALRAVKKKQELPQHELNELMTLQLDQAAGQRDTLTLTQRQ